MISVGCKSSSPGSPPSSPQTDLCSQINDVGNGHQIISGPSGPSGSDYDQAFRSLTVSPTDANVLLIGTERNGFVRSTDGGVTWSRHRMGLRHDTGIGYPEIWDITIAPSNTNVVYAATLDSPGPTYGNVPSAKGGVYKSVDGGQTWVRKSCGLPNSRVTAIQAHPSDHNTVVLALEYGIASFGTGEAYAGGLYYTVNGGDTWSAVSSAASIDNQGSWMMTYVTGGSPGFLTFSQSPSGGAHAGFLRSDVSGQAWSALSVNPFASGLIVHFGSSSDGQTIYANQRDSFTLWRTTDGGANWTNTGTNANGPVAVSPADSARVVYAANENLYLSTDGLATAGTLVLATADFVLDIVFAPTDPNIVYAISRGYFLYGSTNGGATFSLIRNLRTDVLNVIP